MANTNISSDERLEKALDGVPPRFRSRIIKPYVELKQRNFKARFDSSFDAAGLSAGKFCEAVLRFIQFQLTDRHTEFGTHITNFADECHKIIGLPKTTGLESVRVIIPRALTFVYTLRGKRGIGHVGGDVEANAVDLQTIVRIADWIVCELIRVYHHLSLEEAQALVDSVSTRSLPLVWEVRGKKRILEKALNYKEKVLVLVYSDSEKAVFVEDLFLWTDHSHLAQFKRSVLNKLHKDRLIEYDRGDDVVMISPLGIKVVEETILNRMETYWGHDSR